MTDRIRFLLWFIVGLLIISAIGNWTALWFLSKTRPKSVEMTSAEPVSAVIDPAYPVFPAATNQANVSTDNSLLDTFSEMSLQVSSLSSHLDALEKQVKVLQSVPVSATPAIVSSNTTPTQISLYMGSGQTNHREWQTITGAQVTIDPSVYQSLDQVRFEAALHIVGGEVFARLTDTAGTVYYQSEITHNTPSSTWKSSPTFALPNETKIYQVQLRSSSGELGFLDGSRIVIDP